MVECMGFVIWEGTEWVGLMLDEEELGWTWTDQKKQQVNGQLWAVRVRSGLDQHRPALCRSRLDSPEPCCQSGPEDSRDSQLHWKRDKETEKKNENCDGTESGWRGENNRIKGGRKDKKLICMCVCVSVCVCIQQTCVGSGVCSSLDLSNRAMPRFLWECYSCPNQADPGMSPH